MRLHVSDPNLVARRPPGAQTAFIWASDPWAEGETSRASKDVRVNFGVVLVLFRLLIVPIVVGHYLDVTSTLAFPAASARMYSPLLPFGT
jgi:hypothetical protein